IADVRQGDTRRGEAERRRVGLAQGGSGGAESADGGDYDDQHQRERLDRPAGPMPTHRSFPPACGLACSRLLHHGCGALSPKLEAAAETSRMSTMPSPFRSTYRPCESTRFGGVSPNAAAIKLTSVTSTCP